MRALPNLITSFRLACSPLVAWLLLQSHFRWALGVLILAGVSDWMDGWAARRFNVNGKVGIVFDPLSDKGLLVTLFIVLAIIKLVPIWMFALVIGRDVVILVGAFLVRTLRGIKKFQPTVLGKVSTFFQIILVLLAVCEEAFPNRILLGLKETALILSALFTFLSGADYVRIGILMARRRHPLNSAR